MNTMQTYPFILILTTCPRDEVEKISAGLIKKKLAACINVIPKVNSTYFWNNSIQSTIESQLLIKTKSIYFQKIKKYLLESISYENPEIIALPIICGSDDYLKWINDSIES